MSATTSRTLKLVATLLIALIPASAGFAQAVRFECRFSVECSLDNGCTNAAMALQFTWDMTTNQAFMIGNLGLSELAASSGATILGEEVVTFFEPLGSGSAQQTTIMRNGTTVHSRHTILAGTLIPSQWHGVCETEGWQ